MMDRRKNEQFEIIQKAYGMDVIDGEYIDQAIALSIRKHNYKKKSPFLDAEGQVYSILLSSNLNVKKY